MLNGAECWPVKNSHIQKLKVAKIRVLRWMCGFTKGDRVTNETIQEKVGVSVEDKLREALSTLSSISQGDLRRAITYIQGAARLFGSSISAKDLISVSGVIPNEVVQAIFSACRSGNFDLANKEVNNVIAKGYPVSQMLSRLYDIVVDADDISDEQKARICKKFSEADKCLVDGADERLQLLNVASSTMQAPSNMPQDM
ncbi:Replication factor C subunit 4, partial [Capsicum annuum]